MFRLLIIFFVIFKVLANDTSQDSLLSIEIVKESNGKLYAKISDITEQGISAGLDQIQLIGTQEIIQKAILGIGKNQIKVFWEQIDVNGQRVELLEPFYSEVDVEGQIEEGDVFSAKGKPNYLIQAYTNIGQSIDKNREEDEQNKENDSTNYIASRSSEVAGEDSGRINDNLIGDDISFGENFQLAEDIPEEETTNGCSVRVSLEDMKVYVQSKIIKGSEDISDCRDSEAFYAIEKDYKICGTKVDKDAEKIYDQYSLFYNDPEAGKVIISDCEPDTKQFTSLLRDYKTCGITHDFSNAISSNLYRLTDTNGTIYKDCSVDKEMTYTHYTTRSGCQKTVSKDAVIYSKRVAINVDGKEQYISDCEPETTNVKVYEEICGAEKYTHDNYTNQSYLNKTYFYFENGTRNDIDGCVKSATAFNHKFDTALCVVEHNDINKQTVINARRYIEDTVQGGTVYIGDCEPLNEKVAYTKSGEIWQKSDNVTISFNSLSEDYGYFIKVPNTITRTKHDYIKKRYREELYNPSFNRSIRLEQYGCSISRTELKAKYIEESEGAVFNPDNFVLKSNTKFKQYPKGSNLYNAASSKTDKSICRTTLINKYAGGDEELAVIDLELYKRRILHNNISCQGSLLKKRPVYRRYDNSEYIDTNVALDTISICGDGSELNGIRG